jgi:hypothetical protein
MTKRKKEAESNLLIDTCVGLDVAKDYQQQAIVAALAWQAGCESL